MKTYMTVYFGTMLLAMLLVPIVSRLAKWYRLVDTPGPRKMHQTPIPRVGGIALAIPTLALVLGVFFLSNDIGQSFRESHTEFIALLAGACFIFTVGLLDDLHPVPGYIKFLCVIAASLVICAAGATISSISLGTSLVLETNWLAWPLTIFWITTITVCMSVSDALDGLAAGIAVIVCGTIALLALLNGQVAMIVLMLALLGSTTGFLFFNFYPAKIFMGDCGSMFLGFIIGAGSVISQTETSALVGLAIPFLAMGVPIIDTGLVVIVRHFLERRSIFSPDRSHLHHRLLDLGLHQRTVVIILYTVTAISAGIGLLALTVKGGLSVGLLGIGLLFLIAMLMCVHGGRYRIILMILKRNWTIGHEGKAIQRNFEIAQLMMRESRSLRAWWEAVCIMGNNMHFQSIGLWDLSSGNYVSSFVWNAPEEKLTTGKTVKLSLPIQGNGSAEYEIRAHIRADDLELSGRRAMLLARLIEEFPPPEQVK